MIVDRDKWRKYTSMVWMYFGHSMLWPTLGSRTAKEERRAGTRCRQPEHLADSDGGATSLGLADEEDAAADYSVVRP